jgi:hypothetical protein
VHETPEDLTALQELIDRSYANAGTHLLRILTPERRLTAEQVAERLTGVSLLALATRFQHIRQRPQVSATHLPGEELAVTVHGRAVPVDIQSAADADFRRTLLDIYTPRFGEEWEQSFLDAGPVYARIEAERMFTFHMPDGADGDLDA